jgi:hypothetical protein
MMVYFFILVLSHPLFKVVLGLLSLDHLYHQQIQVIGDVWLKNGLKLLNNEEKDILHQCLMEDDIHLATGKNLT